MNYEKSIERKKPKKLGAIEIITRTAIGITLLIALSGSAFCETTPKAEAPKKKSISLGREFRKILLKNFMTSFSPDQEQNTNKNSEKNKELSAEKCLRKIRSSVLKDTWVVLKEKYPKLDKDSLTVGWSNKTERAVLYFGEGRESKNATNTQELFKVQFSPAVSPKEFSIGMKFDFKKSGKFEFETSLKKSSARLRFNF